jgi:alanyl-tRNA synthetase
MRFEHNRTALHLHVLAVERGGGRPDMAQAGGPDGGKAEAALDAIAAALDGG